LMLLNVCRLLGCFWTSFVEPMLLKTAIVPLQVRLHSDCNRLECCQCHTIVIQSTGCCQCHTIDWNVANAIQSTGMLPMSYNRRMLPMSYNRLECCQCHTIDWNVAIQSTGMLPMSYNRLESLVWGQPWKVSTFSFPFAQGIGPKASLCCMNTTKLMSAERCCHKGGCSVLWLSTW
jgi:hypothetical protein